MPAHTSCRLKTTRDEDLTNETGAAREPWSGSDCCSPRAGSTGSHELHEHYRERSTDPAFEKIYTLACLRRADRSQVEALTKAAKSPSTAVPTSHIGSPARIRTGMVMTVSEPSFSASMVTV